MVSSGALERVKHLELYKELGLSQGARLGDVQSSYRRKARRCHPDKHPGHWSYGLLNRKL